MRFKEFIKPAFNIRDMSYDLDEELYIEKFSIKAKRNGATILDNYLDYSNEEIYSLIRDYISKTFNNEFDIRDRISLLTYSKNRDADTDEHLSVYSRSYMHKPMICLIADDFSDHGYIVCYSSRNLQNVIDYIGFPKEGYSFYIFDGKFVAAKAIINKSIDAYVIDPSYKIVLADGCNELLIGNNLTKIYHVRRDPVYM